MTKEQALYNYDQASAKLDSLGYTLGRISIESAFAKSPLDMLTGEAQMLDQEMIDQEALIRRIESNLSRAKENLADMRNRKRAIHVAMGMIIKEAGDGSEQEVQAG